MAASVGTLKAFLTLDSKGWLGGFATAQKAQQQFATKTLKTSTLVGVAAKGLKMFGFSTGGAAARLVAMGLKLGPVGVGLAAVAVGAYVAGKAVHKGVSAIGAAFERLDKKFLTKGLEKERLDGVAASVKSLGLTISNLDGAKVILAGNAFAKFRGVLAGVAEKIAVNIAPALTAMAETLIKNIERMGKSIAAFGASWATVGMLAAETGGFIIDRLSEVAEKFLLAASATKTLEAAWYSLQYAMKGGVDNAFAAANAAVSAQVLKMEALARVAERVSGASSKEFLLRIQQIQRDAQSLANSGKLGGGVGGAPNTQAALERGSMDAARAIPALQSQQREFDNSPAGRLAAQQLQELKNIKDELRRPRGRLLKEGSLSGVSGGAGAFGV